MKAIIALDTADKYADVASTKANKASSPVTPGASVKPVAVKPKPATPKPAAAKPAVAKAKPKSHKVVSGDTLGKIATKYKTTVSALTKLNGIKNANSISVGQVIKLP